MHRPQSALAILTGCVIVISTLFAGGAAVAEPSQSSAAAADETHRFVEYTGTLRVLSSVVEAGGTQAEFVVDAAVLAVDVARVVRDAHLGHQALRLEIPAAIADGLGDEALLDALAAFSRTTAPLIVTGVIADGFRTSSGAKKLADLINVAPIKPTVHRVYASLMTPGDRPGSGPTADQTAEKVAAAVEYADDYWNEQSGGAIRFELAGVLPWSHPTYSQCGYSGTLFNDSWWAAYTQLGYTEEANNHLVLFLPAGMTCMSRSHDSYWGENVNSGGNVFVSGTDTVEAQRALAFELGHNMGLGYADWMACPHAMTDFSSAAQLDECSYQVGGDRVDAMSESAAGLSGGALSSAQGIRSGIWPSTAYKVAPQGATTRYTLNAVSSNNGLRSVVVEDVDGLDYFVEFRDQSDEDTPAGAADCTYPSGTSCLSTTPGIRIMLLEQQAIDCSCDANFYYFFKGFAGDDSFVYGRTVDEVHRIEFVAGESFRSRPAGGVTVDVVSIDGSTATIDVTRPSIATARDYLTIYPGRDWSDGPLRVGEVLSALFESAWRADSATFQWYRNGSPISGATKQNYTLMSADLGKYIKVKVTAKSAGKTTQTMSDPLSGLGYGPVKKGYVVMSWASVDASAIPFRAVGQWADPGVKRSYQWFRNGKAISGATKSTYTPSSADNGKLLVVRITGSKPGYYSYAAASEEADYSIHQSSGALAVAGTPKVGAALTAQSTLDYSSVTGPVALDSRTYQWYRNGVAVAGANGTSYSPKTSDYGAKFVVKETAWASGFARRTVASPSTGYVAKGDIAGTRELPIVTPQPGTTRLTVVLPELSITEPGVKAAYQWYRGSTAITSATGSTYALTSADYAKAIKVRVTITKTNYHTVTLYSPAGHHSIIATPAAPVIHGTVALGETLGVDARSYHSDDGVVDSGVSESYQWYRSGIRITGATSAEYVLAAADLGTTITVKVTAAFPEYLPAVATSAATSAVGKFAMAGWDAQPAASIAETPLAKSRKLEVVETGITEPDVVESYQWYRGSSKITDATKASYTLTSSDYLKSVWVRVTTKKKEFTTIVKDSIPVSYSVIAAGSPVITGTKKVGSTLEVTLPDYAPVDANVAYQWYRDGSAITGATGATRVLTTADKGHYLQVKVVASSVGFLPSTLTSGKTTKIAA